MEMLGVFALVYIGGWACVMESISYGSVLSVAFAHMFVLSVMIWVGNLSFKLQSLTQK